jgi:hypothetical protein
VAAASSEFAVELVECFAGDVTVGEVADLRVDVFALVPAVGAFGAAGGGHQGDISDHELVEGGVQPQGTFPVHRRDQSQAFLLYFLFRVLPGWDGCGQVAVLLGGRRTRGRAANRWAGRRCSRGDDPWWCSSAGNSQ